MTVNEFVSGFVSFKSWIMSQLNEFGNIFAWKQDWGESSLLLVIIVIIAYIWIIFFIIDIFKDIFSTIKNTSLFLKNYLSDKEFRHSYNERKRKEKEEWKIERMKMSFIKRFFSPTFLYGVPIILQGIIAYILFVLALITFIIIMDQTDTLF
jgi:uncharacterized membrane protein YbhN (UPF0104 family)